MHVEFGEWIARGENLVQTAAAFQKPDQRSLAIQHHRAAALLHLRRVAHELQGVAHALLEVQQ